MYTGLVAAHSGLRWIVILTALYAIVKSYQGWKGNKPFSGAFKSSGTIFISSLHIQFLLGLVIYLQSPWFEQLQTDAGRVMSNPTARFYAVEHITLMLVAVVIGTILNARAKRKQNDQAKHKARFWAVIITLLIILVAIPWPFRIPAAGWF